MQRLESLASYRGVFAPGASGMTLWYHASGGYFYALANESGVPAADVGCFWSHASKCLFTPTTTSSPTTSASPTRTPRTNCSAFTRGSIRTRAAFKIYFQFCI